MDKKLPKKYDLSGERFGRLTVICLSDRRAARGKRSVPLWECKCDCGNITYKATDTLKNADVSMCADCAKKYAIEKMRAQSGYRDGTQISRITSHKLISTNTSGCRGVYYDRNSKKWRARIKFKGKLINLGSYAEFDEAAKARRAAEATIYASFIEHIKEK